MSKRFEYAQYSQKAVDLQTTSKERFIAVETQIERLPDGREKSLALTKLEECYMWFGKALREVK